MSNLSSCPPRPKSRRSAPCYPRALLVAGLALNVAGCMGAAPDAYQPEDPSQVVVQQPATGYAQPPSGDDPAPVEPIPGDDPPLAGEAPAPYEQ